jgi:glycosyltransferase involved in cell wall biosynthesis
MNRPDKKLTITCIDNVCDPAKPGASGHSDIIWEAGEYLLKAGHRVRIVGDYSANNFPYQHENLEVITLKSNPFYRRNGLGRVLHVRTAYGRVKSYKDTDLFFTTDAFSAGVTARLSKRVPVLFLTPANIYQRQASSYKLDPIASFFYRLVSHDAAKFSRHIIATSRDLKQWWIKTGAKPENISVIPLGANIEAFAKLQSKTAPQKLRLLYVARFEGGNNPQLLVDLALHLKKLQVDFELSAVGAGSLLENVKEDVTRHKLDNVIRFYGHVPYEELAAIYEAHDVFVFMREAGGPPRVVLQAMASGLAVVAFNSSGLEDYLETGKSGYLVRNGQIGEIASTVARLEQNREHLASIQTTAKATAMDAFDWRTVTAKYNTILSKVVHEEQLVRQANLKKEVRSL